MNTEKLWAAIDRIADPSVTWKQQYWHACLAGHVLQADGWAVQENACDYGEQGCEHSWELSKGDEAVRSYLTRDEALKLLEVEPAAWQGARLCDLFEWQVTLPEIIAAAIELDPEGAARRARSMRPQYDQERVAAEYGPKELADCE